MSQPDARKNDTGVLQGADDPELQWFKQVYKGHQMPQLTWRAVLIGGLLGALMSVSNLYTTLKVGWSFGVAITACVMSYVIWNVLRFFCRRLTPMSILENNCMQSTASAAGYSTGATLASAFGALLLIQGQHLDWMILLAWTLVTACLGVFIAVPLKKQMINHEQLPFPSGIAAAETLQSLYGQSRDAVRQAKALVLFLFIGAMTGVAGKADYAWQKAINFKLPELWPFATRVLGVKGEELPNFGFEPSVLLVGAGMIVGMRVSLSMLLGSACLYLWIGPHLIAAGDIESPAKLLRWSLWTGTACMVTSGLAAFALQWRTVARAFKSIGHKPAAGDADMQEVEVPFSWFVSGMIPLSIAMIVLQYVAFSIAPALGLLAVLMSFALALVACRATGETDITPIGAMGKITQLTYAILAPSNMVTNLMAASVTANTASSSADLLTDLKSGYLLGANARKQFLAQLTGVFFGAAAVIPAWYLMVPNKQALEAFNPPAANMWHAVAQALAYGVDFIPLSARWGILMGGAAGIMLTLLDNYWPPAKRFGPSAMGLGLSFVVPFANCLSFFLGALISWLWFKKSAKSASTYVVPIASGAIAGESLACAAVAMINAAGALGK